MCGVTGDLERKIAVMEIVRVVVREESHSHNLRGVPLLQLLVNNLVLQYPDLLLVAVGHVVQFLLVLVDNLLQLIELDIPRGEPLFHSRPDISVPGVHVLHGGHARQGHGVGLIERWQPRYAGPR